MNRADIIIPPVKNSTTINPVVVQGQEQWLTGLAHERLHDITSLSDHAPVAIEHRGKLLKISSTGAISFTYVTYVNEQLIGIVDGSNRIFTTSAPYVAGSLMTFLNGNKERLFTETNETTITMDTAPKNTGFTDILETIYVKK